MEASDWIVLYTLSSDIEADIITGILETENIPVQKKYPGVNSMLNITMGKPLTVELLVPEALAEKARELIETDQFKDDEERDQALTDHAVPPFGASPFEKLPWYWWLILIAALAFMLMKI